MNKNVTQLPGLFGALPSGPMARVNEGVRATAHVIFHAPRMHSICEAVFFIFGLVSWALGMICLDLGDDCGSLGIQFYRLGDFSALKCCRKGLVLFLQLLVFVSIGVKTSVSREKIARAYFTTSNKTKGHIVLCCTFMYR